MAEHITSVLDKDVAGDLSLADVLYIIQGTGPNRDRNVTLEKLRDFLQLNNKDVVVTGGEFKSELTANKLTITDLSVAGGGTFEFSYMDGIVRKNINGGTLWKITGNGTELSGEVYVPNVKFKSDGIHILTPQGSELGILVKVEDNKLKVTGDTEVTGNGKFTGTFEAVGRASFENGFDSETASRFWGRVDFGKSTDSADKKVVITNGNISAGSKIKVGSGLIIKHLDSTDQLPSSAEDGEMYMVKDGNADYLFVYDGKTNNKWRGIAFSGVYPA